MNVSLFPAVNVFAKRINTITDRPNLGAVSVLTFNM